MIVQHMGMSDDELDRMHNIEILSDAGHAHWISDSMVRITNEGYDFLQAIQQGEQYRATFLERINMGIEYVRVAAEVVEWVKQSVPPID